MTNQTAARCRPEVQARMASLVQSALQGQARASVHGHALPRGWSAFERCS
jgi:hypothetical protein